ncbi:hypothetical protein MTO96_049747 [Rhipicephalus appendiculatus]
MSSTFRRSIKEARDTRPSWSYVRLDAGKTSVCNGDEGNDIAPAPDRHRLPEAPFHRDCPTSKSAVWPQTDAQKYAVAGRLPGNTVLPTTHAVSQKFSQCEENCKGFLRL